jgi:hypothetical protein
MKISKQNICPNPNYQYKNGFFNDLDCFYNFKHSFQEAIKDLNIASRYLIYDSKLDKKIRKLIKLVEEIQIED